MSPSSPLALTLEPRQYASHGIPMALTASRDKEEPFRRIPPPDISTTKAKTGGMASGFDALSLTSFRILAILHAVEPWKFAHRHLFLHLLSDKDRTALLFSRFGMAESFDDNE